MPLSNPDSRDAQAQKALLGESAYQLEDNTRSSPINTPSPSLDGLSPLSVASHLQDASDGPFQVKDINPFLDASWKSTPSRMLDESDNQPVRLVLTSASPKRKTRSVPVTPEPSSATLLPTIQEATTSTSAPPPIPRRQKQSTTMNPTYSLPPSALGISTSSSTGTHHLRRRPSPFPLGPPPPPPPQRRARYEPRPHIVDLATEQLRLNSPSPTSSSSASVSASELQRERERQWKLWDEERLRSQEMTREAAKNNRAPRPSTAAMVQEKPSSSPASQSSSSHKVSGGKRRRWWCFGNAATESDVEDSHDNEKLHQRRPTISRSNSRLSTASTATEDEEDESDESRTTGTANAGSGLLGFGCASRKHHRTGTGAGAGAESNRQRATLKKRAL